MDVQHTLEKTCILCLKSPCEVAARGIVKIEGEPAYATVECSECSAIRKKPTRQQEFQITSLPLKNLAQILAAHRA